MVFASMPESPYFLIMRGKKKAAKKVLQILSGKKDVEKDILRIEEGFEENNSTQKNPLDLFRKSNNRKGIIIILCLKAFQEFSGDTAINEYSQYIFKEAKVDISEEIATFIFFVVELVVTGISALLIDTSGRRRLLIVSSLGSALSILTEGIYFYLKFNTNIDLSNFNIIPLIALVTFVICFCAGLRGIHFVLLGELFTQTVKAPAVCVAYLSDEILIIIVSKFLQLFENRLEMHIPFITFGVFTCIGMVFIILYVPETKGKTLEEIQYSLKAKNN
ncbi:facilitated trehalose transporter Tret1-like [Diorhabda carinulata]|uniref:facilitated trehalose transporter Tret1-like n=1 Tax=Diorhabda carinulata TaxID=1163345 RepID=UPI0025A24A53|nr:facilitated trehalose transporter Tret1-like [Diorhabda carinulata]